MKLEEKINYLKEIDIKLNKNYIYIIFKYFKT